MVSPAPSRPTRTRRRLAVAAVALVAGLAPLLAWSAPASADDTCADLAVAKERFVCLSYVSFVERTPAFAELSYWSARMPAQKTVFLATLARSEESRRRIIEEYYLVYGQSPVTPPEMAYWLPEVLKPNGFRRLEAGLLGGYVGMIDGFLDKAFDTVLGRDPTAGESTYWGTRVVQTSRTQVAADLIYTLESRRRVATWAYYHEQNVDVDAASRDYWAERMRTGTSYLDVRIQLKTAIYTFGSGACSSQTPPVTVKAGCET